MIIGIGGVSNAGKTTLSQKLKEQLKPLQVSILCQDDFPSPISGIPLIRDHVDWEIPVSIDLTKFYRRVLADEKKFDIVIAEGLFTFYSPEILKLYHKRIFLTISKETFRRRKSSDFRWGKEPEWYIEHIWDNHFKYGIRNSVNQNTLIVSGEGLIDLDRLITSLEIEKHFAKIIS